MLSAGKNRNSPPQFPDPAAEPLGNLDYSYLYPYVKHIDRNREICAARRPTGILRFPVRATLSVPTRWCHRSPHHSMLNFSLVATFYQIFTRLMTKTRNSLVISFWLNASNGCLHFLTDVQPTSLLTLSTSLRTLEFHHLAKASFSLWRDLSSFVFHRTTSSHVSRITQNSTYETSLNL